MERGLQVDVEGASCLATSQDGVFHGFILYKEYVIITRTIMTVSIIILSRHYSRINYYCTHNLQHKESLHASICICRFYHIKTDDFIAFLCES